LQEALRNAVHERERNGCVGLGQTSGISHETDATRGPAYAISGKTCARQAIAAVDSLFGVENVVVGALSKRSRDKPSDDDEMVHGQDEWQLVKIFGKVVKKCAV
jgi:hypothetical protein